MIKRVFYLEGAIRKGREKVPNDFPECFHQRVIERKQVLSPRIGFIETGQREKKQELVRLVSIIATKTADRTELVEHGLNRRSLRVHRCLHGECVLLNLILYLTLRVFEP